MFYLGGGGGSCLIEMGRDQLFYRHKPTRIREYDDYVEDITNDAYIWENNSNLCLITLSLDTYATV